jgi:hypothetical protein
LASHGDLVKNEILGLVVFELRFATYSVSGAVDGEQLDAPFGISGRRNSRWGLWRDGRAGIISDFEILVSIGPIGLGDEQRGTSEDKGESGAGEYKVHISVLCRGNAMKSHGQTIPQAGNLRVHGGRESCLTHARELRINVWIIVLIIIVTKRERACQTALE